MNETPGGLVIRVERGAPPHRGVAHDVCAAHVTYLKVLRGPEKEVRVVEAHLVGGEVLTFSGPAAQAFLWAWERRMGVYWASWYPWEHAARTPIAQTPGALTLAAVTPQEEE